MVRKTSFVIVLGAAASPAAATTLLYEPFNYGPVGTEISTADGAGGWAKVPSGTTFEPTIGDGSIAYAPLPFTPIGNKVVGNSAGTGVLASSTRAIPGQPYMRAENQTLYYSALLNVTDVAGLATGGSFIAGFRNNTSTNGLAGYEGGAALLLRQTATGSGLFHLGVGLTQETVDRVYDSANAYSETTGPMLLVLSYQFVSGGNDVAKLWVNPDPTLTEAANAAALKASRTSPDLHGIGNSNGLAENLANQRITNFFLRNNGSAPDGWEMDELRIATSWEGVMSNLVPGIWLGGPGNWSDATKWSGGTVPNSIAQPVHIDAGQGPTSIVTLDQDASARSLTVSSGDTFNIPAARTLTLATPLVVNGVVNTSGTINAPSVTISGSGSELHYDAGAIQTSGSVGLSGGAKLLMSSGANKVLKATNLSISSTSKVDLADNKIILTAGAIGTATNGTYNGVLGDIQRAYNFGTWDGAAGLTTSEELANQASGPLGGTTGIAVNKASEVLFIGDTDTAMWAGHTVTGSSVLVMYTYAGDVNFDGLVDAADYGVIDNWVQFPGTDGYANGDFNFDGIIDAADYGIIDNTVQLQGAPLPTGASGAGAAVVAVPEPAGVISAAAAASLLLGRRRRRRRAP